MLAFGFVERMVSLFRGYQILPNLRIILFFWMERGSGIIGTGAESLSFIFAK